MAFVNVCEGFDYKSKLISDEYYLPKEAVKWILSLQVAQFVTIEVRSVSIDYNSEGKFHFGVVLEQLYQGYFYPHVDRRRSHV